MVDFTQIGASVVRMNTVDSCEHNSNEPKLI